MPMLGSALSAMLTRYTRHVPETNEHLDAAIVGAGAAGITTGIFLARRRPDWRIALFDGAQKVGAKILISGGGRCNVTNQVVTPSDYWGGSPHLIRRILDRFSATDAIAFFREMGVDLKTEPEFGKLFPRSDSARAVLSALLAELERCGPRIRCGARIASVTRRDDLFRLHLADGTDPPISARKLVIATGGRSFPKTGSDGAGYCLAESLGHSIVPTTPSLAALILDGSFHARLSGVTVDVEITARVDGRRVWQRRGPLLWTHFGVSGPEAMNVSRIWHRATLENRTVSILLNFAPGETEESIEKWIIAQAGRNPRASLANVLAERIPARVAEALLLQLSTTNVALAHLPRDARREISRLLTHFELPIRNSRGFAHAEATAGGIPLAEINPATLESRCCPNLYFAGEILDVDGRIGGFNFQWAWSSAFVAAAGIACA